MCSSDMPPTHLRDKPPTPPQRHASHPRDMPPNQRHVFHPRDISPTQKHGTHPSDTPPGPVHLSPGQVFYSSLCHLPSSLLLLPQEPLLHSKAHTSVPNRLALRRTADLAWLIPLSWPLPTDFCAIPTTELFPTQAHLKVRDQHFLMLTGASSRWD